MKYSSQSTEYEYYSKIVPPHIKAEERGIVMVAYDATIYSLYANIKIIRELGCLLPIEIWYRPQEIRTCDAILIKLQQEYPETLVIREIVDPSATHFYVKPYAVYHSHFDQVLFLDSDNTPLRDPTYLFETEEFKQKGTIFWPDYWQPSNTIFNLHSRSMIWELIGVEYADMFEQESGQLLIDKTRSKTALEVEFHNTNILRYSQNTTK